MRENKYDDPAFFAAYSQFPRSVAGLSAAGEWHALQRMLPDLAGKRVLDLGCGFGWHCVYAAEHGAAQVVGTDISARMLAVAKQKTTSPYVTYRQIAIEDIAFAPNSFDLVLSSLALHYVESFEAVCHALHRCLSPGGVFVFSVEHPIFTAQGTQDWHYDAEGCRAHWPVDRYFEQGKRNSIFLGTEVVKYHKTLTTYIGGLCSAGFQLTTLVEPQPEAHLLHTVPGMEDEVRRPMMLLISATK